MSMKITPEQKSALTQVILAALVALVVSVATLFVLKGSPSPAPASAPIGVKAIQYNGIICDSGEPNCVDSTGMNIVVRNAARTPVTQIDHSGYMTVTQNISVGGAYVGITPVATATAINTPTPATNITATVVSANSMSIAGTPVIPFATPQSLFVGSVAKQYRECHTTTVTGTLTVTPVAASLTPVAAPVKLNQALTGDAYAASSSVSGNVVTLYVFGNEATPVANTTPAAVYYCIEGTVP